MHTITLQLTKDELRIIDLAKEARGFRSRSDYIRQAVIQQAKNDLEANK